MLCDYIRSDVLANEKIVRLTDMTENLPICNVEDGCCPRSGRFVELTRQEALENERRKKPSKGLRRATCGHIRTQCRAVEKSFLNPKNKMTLAEFVAKGWRPENYKYRTKLTGKVIFDDMRK